MKGKGALPVHSVTSARPALLPNRALQSLLRSCALTACADRRLGQIVCQADIFSNAQGNAAPENHRLDSVHEASKRWRYPLVNAKRQMSTRVAPTSMVAAVLASASPCEFIGVVLKSFRSPAITAFILSAITSAPAKLGVH